MSQRSLFFCFGRPDQKPRSKRGRAWERTAIEPSPLLISSTHICVHTHTVPRHVPVGYPRVEPRPRVGFGLIVRLWGECARCTPQDPTPQPPIWWPGTTMRTRVCEERERGETLSTRACAHGQGVRLWQDTSGGHEQLHDTTLPRLRRCHVAVCVRAVHPVRHRAQHTRAIDAFSHAVGVCRCEYQSVVREPHPEPCTYSLLARPRTGGQVPMPSLA